MVDSFSVSMCRFARAPRCRSFGGVAAFGHDEVARPPCYGRRAHVHLAWLGILVDCDLAPANIHDTEGAEEVLQVWRAMFWQTVNTGNLSYLSG